MRRSNGSVCLFVAVVICTSACESPVDPVSSPLTAPPIALSVVSGSGQTGEVGIELSAPLVVRVTTQQGKKTVGVARHLVNFRVVTGAGSVFAGSALTDNNGMAQEYWTLGPNVGENVVEVRSVEPSTGEKQIFARFIGYGVIPGPEVCNGLDDNLDGTADDPTWRYCNSGTAAANTDGKNGCSSDYIDINGSSTDGCERLVGGRWTLTPAVHLSCSPLPIGFSSATLHGFDVAVASASELSVTPILEFGFLGSLVQSSLTPIRVPIVPVAETFAGSVIFNFSNPPFAGAGTAAINGIFTTPTSFQTTVNVTLGFTVTLLGFPVDVTCNDVNTTVTGTRQIG